MLINLISFSVTVLLIVQQMEWAERKDILLQTDTIAIKGVAVLFVFFAHFYNELISRGAEVGIGRIWLVTGGLGVELFFFLSGYGLNKSNGIMRRDFLQKRAKGVLLPFIIIQVILYLISLLCGERISVFSFGLSAFSSTWFVSVILIIYIGYYICYKLFGRKYLDCSMLVYNIIIGIIFMMLGFDQRWYNGHLLFSLGMYMADHNEKVVNIVTGKKWWLKFTGGIVGFLGCSVIYIHDKGALWSNIFKILAGVFMCFAVFCIMGHCKLNSKMLQWVGKNSLLIYMIHIAVLNHLSSDMEIPNAVILVIGIAVTLAGVIVYNCGGKCMKICMKRISL